MTDLQNCTDAAQEEIELALHLLNRTVIDNPYIPVAPTEPQAVFLTVPVKEVMYGGAGGGGKSIALLMAALQYVEEPGYSAVLFRRTYDDLNLPDGLIPLSHEWLSGGAAKWNGQNHQWTFPNGATLTFRYLENENDKYKYKGPSFQFIGFDELTGFSETQYRFLFQRLRRPSGMTIPLRMRSATNPGDVGHEWVKKRFIDGTHTDRLFVPAKLEDNPYLDAVSYEDSLSNLDPVTRRQFRHGDWHVRPEGSLFKRDWFNGRIGPPPAVVRAVRFWDCAATEVGENGNNDPDYTVGLLMGVTLEKTYVVLDVQRFRESWSTVKKRMRQTAQRDGANVEVRIEQEGGAQAKGVAVDVVRDVFQGFDARAIKPRGSKVERSKPMQAAAERGDVYIAQGAWNDEYLDELCAFGTETAHDDQVDASTGGFEALSGEPRGWGESELKAVFSRTVGGAKQTPMDLLKQKLAGR